jgi:uncharacterized protein (DUF1684 family)
MLTTPMDATLHQRTVVAWQRARQDRLRAPDGWLTLVDRLILAEGDNPLPFGVVTVRAGTAELRRPETAAGAPRALRLEEAITCHGKSYELSRRGDELSFRVKDPEAPARLAFAGLTYYPIDPAWRVVARWESYTPPHQTHHQYESGMQAERQIPGAAHFSVAGQSFSLEPVLEEASARLYLIFGDATNRSDTYPAGRFLYAELPSPGSDQVVLDFNMAFNPPCAFTEHAACPITPPRHRLPIAVPAGEKRPADMH